ncbi:MAG: LpxI family protein [Chlamydiota bacterium]
MVSETIAVIGGEGMMPRLVIDELHKAGKKTFLIAVKGCTPKDLENHSDETLWLYLTQLGKAIKACTQRGIEEVIMAGRVGHTAIFGLSILRMDFTALKLWFSLPDKRTDTILKAIAEAFENKGLMVANSVKYLQDYMAKKGVLTKKKPSKQHMRDITLGVEVAREMGNLDVGQTVVVKNGSIVAVEAMEGTDQCIQRAGDIAGEGCVVVKMAKPQQDMRFDVPTIGKNTLEKLNKIKGAALAIEANKTLVIDGDALDYANEQGLAVVSVI